MNETVTYGHVTPGSCVIFPWHCQRSTTSWNCWDDKQLSAVFLGCSWGLHFDMFLIVCFALFCGFEMLLVDTLIWRNDFGSQWHRLCERSHWYTAGSCILLRPKQRPSKSGWIWHARSTTESPVKALAFALLDFMGLMNVCHNPNLPSFYHLLWTKPFELIHLLCPRTYTPRSKTRHRSPIVFRLWFFIFFVLNQIGRNDDVQNRFQHVPAMLNKFSICICHHMSPQLIATLISGCAWPFFALDPLAA